MDQDRAPVNAWVDLKVRQNISVFLVKRVDEVAFFENRANLADQVVAKYEELAEKTGQPTCVIVIETQIAPSPLIRLIYKLFKACQKRRATLYVCSFPDEYQISLSTLALTQQSGFELRATEEAALKEISRD